MVATRSMKRKIMASSGAKTMVAATPRRRNSRKQITTPSQRPSSRDGSDSKQAQAMRCAVRVRPGFGEKINHNLIVQDTVNSIVSEGSSFTFDSVFDASASQADLFDSMGMPLVSGLLEGYNACLFAYGQTGSGKTHTMSGNDDNKGMIPRCLAQLFTLLEAQDEVSFELQCSLLEIYNEQVLDLLAPTNTQESKKKLAFTSSQSNTFESLSLRQNASGLVYVDKLTNKIVTTEEEAMATLAFGLTQRTVAATQLNAESSRSHLVFSVTLTTSREIKGGNKESRVTTFHMIDLAGSEKQKDAKTRGMRLKEAGQINKSLSALGNVIGAIVNKEAYIPYRNSKLTYLLKDCLGGTSRTCLIANVSPGASSAQETLSTLKFASRCRKVENVVTQAMTSVQGFVLPNTTVSTAELKQSQERIAALELQLSSERTINNELRSLYEEKEQQSHKRRRTNDGLAIELAQPLADSVMLQQVTEMYKVTSQLIERNQQLMGLPTVRLTSPSAREHALEAEISRLRTRTWQADATSLQLLVEKERLRQDFFAYRNNTKADMKMEVWKKEQEFVSLLDEAFQEATKWQHEYATLRAFVKATYESTEAKAAIPPTPAFKTSSSSSSSNRQSISVAPEPPLFTSPVKAKKKPGLFQNISRLLSPRVSKKKLEGEDCGAVVANHHEKENTTLTLENISDDDVDDSGMDAAEIVMKENTHDGVFSPVISGKSAETLRKFGNRRYNNNFKLRPSAMQINLQQT